MGNVAGYRSAWIAAEGYRRKWDKWNADHKGDPRSETRQRTLAEVLRGNIPFTTMLSADEMAR